MNSYSRYAPVIVRIGMSLVFLWFGTNQLMHPTMWAGVVPAWVSAMTPGGASTVVHINGWFEIVAGLCLVVGFQVRLVALLLGLHLLGIASSFGVNSPIGVRDFGLTIATLSIFFAGADVWSVDKKMMRQTETETSI
jgi:uncharacterized membrane protein YphA (DoxX/SURF4 family)